jgi:midasin (ATPase involved in ribosome maturation)
MINNKTHKAAPFSGSINQAPNMASSTRLKNRSYGNSIEITIPNLLKSNIGANLGVTEASEISEVRHEKFDIIKTCISNSIPVYLSGPSGSGKKYVVDQISWELGLELYITETTETIQSKKSLIGFIDNSGTYHETEFYKAFKHGGIFFISVTNKTAYKTIDLLKSAIINKCFVFPNEKVEAHKNFRIVLAENNSIIKQSVLEQFAYIDFCYDKNIELYLSNGNKELINFVQTIRKEAENNNIPVLFNYHCISMITKLEQTKLDTKTILQIALFKCMNKEDLDCLKCCNINSNNKYKKVLIELQGIA